MLPAKLKKSFLILGAIICTAGGAYLLGGAAADAVASAKYQNAEDQRAREIMSKLNPNLQTGGTLPDAKFISITGEILQLSEILQSKTLITYISPSCPICLVHIQNIIKNTAGIEDRQGFILISNADPDYLQEMKSEFDIDFPILYDQGAVYNESYLNVTSVPFNFIVDNSLQIQSFSPGRVNIEEIQDIVESNKL